MEYYNNIYKENTQIRTVSCGMYQREMPFVFGKWWKHLYRKLPKTILERLLIESGDSVIVKMRFSFVYSKRKNKGGTAVNIVPAINRL